jgi:cGMP-dependent protein kinase
LKSIDRCKIDNKKIQQSLILERKILMQLDHSFILKLVKTFKDTKRVYFLTEYVRGQDLFDVIRKIGLLSNEDSLFYTACLLLIFEHLHERDIVYRDLKPENVMIDEEGYPKLIDFGTAKIVQGRTFTMIGTPHYMAPEVILGKGYGISVDYWSIGIILYEFMCGGVPFGENECDNYNIYEKILQGKLFYPDYAEITENAKQMIEQFLSKNPAMRVGGGVENLKKHPWFQGLDWEAIWDRTAEAPHRPEILSFAHDIEKVLKVANDHRRTNSDRNGQEIESDPLSWDHEF